MLLCVPVIASAQKKEVKRVEQDTEAWRYEIEAENVGLQGTCVVKVWTYSPNPSLAADQSKKNAIHGVIFKGVPAKDRIPGKKPLFEDSARETEFAVFFKDFFRYGGDYERFVTLTTNGAIDAEDIMKVDKKTYKVGVVVTVNYNELRSHLEGKGVIKKLNSGF